MWAGGHFSLFIIAPNQALCYQEYICTLAVTIKAFKKLILMFYHCFTSATDVCWAVKMIPSLLINTCARD